MKPISELKTELKYWTILADQVDQCIDIMLNLSQSGHPGGSRSKVHVVLATLLSGVMHWDVRNPAARFADRFILSAGHTNPLIYGTLAVFNEALRRKYSATGNEKYETPLGKDFTLYWEDLLTLRRVGGLPGHAEMEGKTLFFKANTGPSGHGLPIAAGQALALKHAGFGQVRVFAVEGEGGLTAGVSHETKNSAFGLGLGNFITVLDWNDWGIDNRPFSSVVHGTPRDWFEPYGWKVEGVAEGSNFEAILKGYENLFADDDPHQPKLLYVKTRKGRGYYKYDAPSHGAPHKTNSPEFWHTKRDFADKYGLEIPFMDTPAPADYAETKRQMAELLKSVMSLFDRKPDYLDFLADKLISLADSVPETLPGAEKFEANPLDDPVIYDYKNYPVSLYKPAGEKAPNRAGFADFGSWINTYTNEKYGRPLFLVNSADLAGSTNIVGFSKGWDGAEDFGMYDRNTNLKGTLLPQCITEFANAGINVGIACVNLGTSPFEGNYNGYLSAGSTYGAFAYLKYGAYRLYSQMAQDTQLKIGKTIWVAGHSGPETAEDSRTHFGIFAPGVTQLFPEGQILNLYPYEYNEVPVMLGAALGTDIPIIALHLTRPAVEIPDREALGMASHFEAAKGAYLIRDYSAGRPSEGVVIIRGTKPIDELVSILPEINAKGPNVKIVAALSHGLFQLQSQAYQESVISATEWQDAMIITNTALKLMENWIKHPVVKTYSLSSDWDNRWRSGGTIPEVIEEAHLSARWQLKAIRKFAADRPARLEKIRKMLPDA
ncbi:MAG: transketolase [FCB group bacterium]|nr:transketolase [FCB group bacterium]